MTKRRHGIDGASILENSTDTDHNVLQEIF